MKLYIGLILFIVTSGFITLKTTPSVWKELRHLEGRFRVLVPNDMTEKKQKIKTELGEIDYHQFIYQPTEKNPDNVFYLVNYCDYPKGTFNPDSTDLINTFLNETVESSAKSVMGKVSYQGDIYLSKSKGKIWRVQYNNDKALIKSKCYLVNDRFYLIQTMMVKEKSLNPSADKFLDSFDVF
jgi:hypothetical protein